MPDPTRPLDVIRDALDPDDLAAAERLYGPAETWTWETLLLVRRLLEERVETLELGGTRPVIVEADPR